MGILSQLMDFWDGLVPVISFIAIFIMIVLASGRIGTFFNSLHLPLITGFLAAGFVAGPDLLGLITGPAVDSLNFVNQIALAVIALAAGNELRLKEYRDRFRSITWLTIGLVTTTFMGGTAVMFFLTSQVAESLGLESISGLPVYSRLAISSLAGVILVARSPSSAIAIVSELRAKGPFTHTTLGVTVIMDAVVIIMFAVASEVTHAVLSDIDFNASFAGLLLLELGLSVFCGIALWQFIVMILRVRLQSMVKSALVVLVGFATFLFAEWLAQWSSDQLEVTVFMEPLLACMIAGILVANFSSYHSEFSQILRRVGPPVYLAFFTLTGASIKVGVLIHTWQIALILVLIRLFTIFLGTVGGGLMAGETRKRNMISWMGFVTQAGVGIGLARQIARQEEFIPWGDELATILIAVIIINQVIGPPLFKWAISIAGESRTRAPGHAFDGIRTAVILGHKTGQPLMLAERLIQHAWEVTLVVVDAELEEEIEKPGINVVTLEDVTVESLESLDLLHADALISLLTDDENVQVCELNYEKFGIEKVVVWLDDNLTHGKRCHDLGALVLDPKTSKVSLLEHSVTSPTATSILLGLDPEQEVMEIQVRDRVLDGVPIRDLRIPHSVIILSVTRGGHALVSHGYMTLKLGDQLTVMGPPEVLPYTAIYFDR
jgi:Trk K+ transport system NAD-binding subunit/Kef-type K+ transport system membrane component KefB